MNHSKLKLLSLLILAQSVGFAEEIYKPDYAVGFGASLNLTNQTIKTTYSSSTGQSFQQQALSPTDFVNTWDFVVINGNFRGALEVGYYSDYSESSKITDTRELTMSKIGIGAFYQNNLGNSDIYYGLRVGMLNYSLNTNYIEGTYATQKDENTQQFINLSPTLGADYWFSKNFSIGTEVRLNYLSQGALEYTSTRKNSSGKDTTVSGESSMTGSLTTTNAYINLKAYF
jgi:hypothetical protein